MGKETVNHPSHYNVGKYEVIDVIYNWGLDFDLGNAVKYIARAGHKGSGTLSQFDKTIEDLKKAIWYLEHKKKMIRENKYPLFVPLINRYNERDVVKEWQLPDNLAKAIIGIVLLNNSDTWELTLNLAIENINVYIDRLQDSLKEIKN